MRNEAAAQRSKVVDGLIQQLGLSKAAHTKIGDARSRGVSGGERKVSDTLYTSSGDMCMRVVCLRVVKGGKGVREVKGGKGPAAQESQLRTRTHTGSEDRTQMGNTSAQI